MGICAGCVGSAGHGSPRRCAANCPAWRDPAVLRIVNAVFDALVDPVGVAAHRAGALERAQLVLQDCSTPAAVWMRWNRAWSTCSTSSA
jgi:hypothetical protein